MANSLEKQEELADNVFDYIIQEKATYETRGVPLTDNWEWKMKDHINRSFSLKNSKFTKGRNDGKRPFKNIIIPIANVNYRTEGFDVKDVDLFVDDQDHYHLSLLARKYYSKWALENGIDKAIDEATESDFDFGLQLLKNVNEKRPEVVQLQSIAFCDQTDVLAGPICLFHPFSIDQLDEMKGKWYETEIEEAITQAQAKKNVSLAKKDAKTPGKYIEVYELHGVFPKTWLNTEKSEDYTEEDGYCRQIHIITFYKGSDGKNNGICLFKGKTKQIFKAKKRNNRFGTACGMGGIEELFDAQTWTNSSEIHLQKMLEATSKIITKTTDKKLINQNLSEMKDGQVVFVEEGKIWEQMVLQPFNKAAFDNYVNAWEQNARALGSASDPALGLNSKSGTPLGETQIVTAQGEGIHDYRRGQNATFWEEVHRDWVVSYLIKDMRKGDKWLDELSLEELQEVAEKVSINTSNKRIKEMILSGKIVTPQEQEVMRQLIKDDFIKGGKKRFLEIMEGEFEKLPLKLKFNVAGKQKNMVEFVGKLNSVFRSVFANPAILQAPGMGELFNQILESAGLSPMNFSQLTQPAQVQQGQPMPGAVPSPIQQPNLAAQV